MDTFYTGVGARDAPKEVLNKITEISLALHNNDYILRTGDAKGCDSAFAKEVPPYFKEIYRPENHLPLWTTVFTDFFHPSPKRLSIQARRLMNRNAMQVLGRDGDTPSQFLICWTKDGKVSGGTGQAMRIAMHFGVPVYNIKNQLDINKLRMDHPYLYGVI